MTKREILDLFVRCLGVYLIGTSLAAVPEMLFGVMGAMFSLKFVGFVLGTMRLLWPFAVGWWFLRGAPQLFQFVDQKPKAVDGAPPPSAA